LEFEGRGNRESHQLLTHEDCDLMLFQFITIEMINCAILKDETHCPK